jgi:dTMP kinase
VGLVAAIEKGVDEVRADEPRATGDERPHPASYPRRRGTAARARGDRRLRQGDAGGPPRRARPRGRPERRDAQLPDVRRQPVRGRDRRLSERRVRNPELAALLYAADRFHARQRLVDAIAAHDLVICDRYVASNAAHQGAKLQGDDRRRLLDWLDAVEYGEFSLPRPDVVVLLDTPVGVARTLVSRKGVRGYTTLEADIHEADAEHTRATRDVYLELAERGGWRVVTTADEDGALRDVDAIADEIWESVR